MAEAISETEKLIRQNGKGYICVTGVHGIMVAQQDAEFRRILNESFLTTPDGMPTVWVGHYQGFALERVYGPDFMLDFCRHSVELGLRHFFYGGSEGVAQALKASMEKMIPGLDVVGTYTPPFRPLTASEFDDLRSLVAQTNPDVMWVGLSTPKQERFMAEHLDKLNVRVMVGVGAAFDIHTGRVKSTPAWIRNIGMQWLHRLTQERKRLWRRYLRNNPRFLWMIFLQLSGLKKFKIPAASGSTQQ